MTYAIERVDTFYIFCTASLFQCNSTPFYNEHAQHNDCFFELLIVIEVEE